MQQIKELVLASHNQGKINELKKLLNPCEIEVISASDLGIDEPEETGETFIDNAILKARYVAEQTGKPALADDSGIVVTSLDGFPGVITGRYSRSFPSLNDCFADLDQRLTGKSRQAYFECALSLYFPSGQHQEFVGQLSGELASTPRGEDGFCFDFVFQPEGEQKTLAELGRTIKNQISHRAIALRKFIDTCLKQTQEQKI